MQEPAVVASGGVRRELAAASAPAAQSGRAAFDAASRSAALSGAGNLVAAKASDATLAPDEASGARRAGGRIFTLRRGVWTDVGQVDSLQITTVAPFSPAYFALVRALPELVPCFGLGDAVLVAGRRMSVRIAPDGATVLGAGQLANLVSGFRGT